jgi:hypothetical protein
MAPMARRSSPFVSAPLVRLVLVLASLQCLTGCGGCNSQSAAEKARQAAQDRLDEEKRKKAEEEKEQPPFNIGKVTPILSESIISTDEDEPIRLAKPNHWTVTVQSMRANKGDFTGRTVVTALDQRQNPAKLSDTNYAMFATRPALLAKGRPKRVLNFVLPPPAQARLSVRSELVTQGGTPATEEDTALWTMMPSHQYFLVVLAREPARYAFLKLADSIKAPYEDEDGVAQPHYRVVLNDGAKVAPLPDSALAWTSVAYFVWDEVNIDRLTPEQRQALVDWVHWGGRLIINGPDSLASLRGSFLDPYLPVDAGKTAMFDDADLAEFNSVWTVRERGKTPPPLKTTRPWSGIELTPRAAARAQALPGAEGLFYECPVGSGTVVVSAMQLTERDLVNWAGFDGFLNGALLRRPPREFREEDGGMFLGLQTRWANATYADRARDAYFTTPLRWFARDAGTKANNAIVMPDMVTDPSQQFTPFETQAVIDRAGGLGSWNEFGPVSAAAREALSGAAGVRVPGSGFVVTCLTVYLIVLVPLNWLIFNALGRVEWAWIAAPIIALAGTIAVVRQAQLDIGFVRSQTEISLLELQGAHDRGHLTRYVALYTSLSTTYNTEFEDATAVATPFPAMNPTDEAQPLIGDKLTTVEFEKYDQPRLKGVPVSSATTQFLHSEQMFQLAGPLRLSSPSTNASIQQLENETGYSLADAVVLRRFFRNNRWNYEAAWLGKLDNGSTHLLELKPIEPDRDELLFAAERAEEAKVDSHKRLNLDALMKLAFTFPPARGDMHDPIQGQRDEYRLVARLDEPLPGAVTTPAASQTTGSTAVLAHLKLELAAAPTPDVNSRLDLREDPRNAAEEDLLEMPDPTDPAGVF